MVMIKVRLPIMAPQRPSTAVVVVFPTPPEPTQTKNFWSRRSGSKFPCSLFMGLTISFMVGETSVYRAPQCIDGGLHVGCDVFEQGTFFNGGD